VPAKARPTRLIALVIARSDSDEAIGTLNYMLSQVLKPGTARQQRQQILGLIDNYSRYDPAEIAHFYDQPFDLLALVGTAPLARPLPKPPAVPPEVAFETTARLAFSAEQRAAIYGNLVHGREEKFLIKSFAAARCMSFPEPSTTLSTAT
jgi:hypothetical protein